MIINVLLTALIYLALLGGPAYLLVRFVRAYERRSAAPAELTTLAERVRLLEESNSRLESELAQVTESQRFTTKLLEERSTANSD